MVGTGKSWVPHANPQDQYKDTNVPFEARALFAMTEAGGAAAAVAQAFLQKVEVQSEVNKQKDQDCECDRVNRQYSRSSTAIDMEVVTLVPLALSFKEYDVLADQDICVGAVVLWCVLAAVATLFPIAIGGSTRSIVGCRIFTNGHDCFAVGDLVVNDCSSPCVVDAKSNGNHSEEKDDHAIARAELQYADHGSIFCFLSRFG